MPKVGVGGNGSNQFQQKNAEIDTSGEFSKPKAESIAEIGLSQKKAERLQQMAKNVEVVHAVMAKARDNDDVVSEAQILNEIKQAKRKQDIQRQVEEIEQQTFETPDGLFDVIVIDPPWNYGTQITNAGYRDAAVRDNATKGIVGNSSDDVMESLLRRVK